MSIEINGPPTRPVTDLADGSKVQPRQGQNGASAVADTARNPGSARDRISLTDQASQLQALEAQISKLPVVDIQRVRAVQHSIATGGFQIDPARVADKLLRFESGISIDRRAA